FGFSAQTLRKKRSSAVDPNQNIAKGVCHSRLGCFLLLLCWLPWLMGASAGFSRALSPSKEVAFECDSRSPATIHAANAQRAGLTFGIPWIIFRAVFLGRKAKNKNSRLNVSRCQRRQRASIWVRTVLNRRRTRG